MVEFLNSVGNTHNDPVHLWQLEFGHDSCKIGMSQILQLPIMTDADAVETDLRYTPFYNLTHHSPLGWSLCLEMIDRRKGFYIGNARLPNPAFVTDKNPFGYLWWQIELGLLFSGDDE